LRHFYLVEHVFPDQEARRSSDVTNVRVLAPAQLVEIASPATDPFVPLGKYFRDGYFVRPDVYVCDIPDAYLYVETGMVCTRNWKVAADLEYRLPEFKQFGARRPRNVRRLTGAYATASYCVAWNHYHWMVDCLPKLVSLARAEPHTPITVIASETLGPVQRESLRAVLPLNFQIAYYPPDTWLQVEKLVWPSLVSGRCNAFLPADYYEAIRRPVFRKFNLPAAHRQTERLYITRRGANRRRVLNEDALESFLQAYGFRTVELEKLSFREQVELFHRADIVVGPHGAGFHLITYSGKIHVVVLHPNPVPQNHFHTLARGLGHEYHFVLHPGQSEEADFEADLPELRRVLEEEIGLIANHSIDSASAELALPPCFDDAPEATRASQRLTGTLPR
jgi:capsular polysaccharide biosynthesis protein